MSKPDARPIELSETVEKLFRNSCGVIAAARFAAVMRKPSDWQSLADKVIALRDEFDATNWQECEKRDIGRAHRIALQYIDRILLCCEVYGGDGGDAIDPEKLRESVDSFVFHLDAIPCPDYLDIDIAEERVRLMPKDEGGKPERDVLHHTAETPEGQKKPKRKRKGRKADPERVKLDAGIAKKWAAWSGTKPELDTELELSIGSVHAALERHRKRNKARKN